MFYCSFYLYSSLDINPDSHQDDVHTDIQVRIPVSTSRKVWAVRKSLARILIEDIWTVSGTELKCQLKDQIIQILSMEYLTEDKGCNVLAWKLSLSVWRADWAELTAILSETVQISSVSIPGAWPGVTRAWCSRLIDWGHIQHDHLESGPIPLPAAHVSPAFTGIMGE